MHHFFLDGWMLPCLSTWCGKPHKIIEVYMSQIGPKTSNKLTMVPLIIAVLGTKVSLFCLETKLYFFILYPDIMDDRTQLGKARYCKAKEP